MLDLLILSHVKRKPFETESAIVSISLIECRYLHSETLSLEK